MLLDTQNQQVQQVRKTMALICSTMMFTVLIYGAVGFIIQNNPKPAADFLSLLQFAFILASFSILICIVFFRRHFLSLPPQNNTENLFEFYLNNMRITTIVTFALCESIAILGFVLFFFSGDPHLFYAFAGPALALMVFFFPRHAQWQAYFERRMYSPSVNPGPAP